MMAAGPSGPVVVVVVIILLYCAPSNGKEEGVTRTRKAQAVLIPSMDIPILRELPKEGTSVGLKPLGATARYLKAKHPEWGLSSNELSGRFKTLRFLGYAVDVVVLPVGNGAGWQITKAGEKLLAEYKEES